MYNIFWVALGGAAGAMLRYISYYFSVRLFPPDFPYATLFVNVVGSLILGFSVILITNSSHFALPLRALLIIGFCGSFTTFSTFSLENIHLLQSHNYWHLSLNILFNIVLCMLTVYIGMWLAHKL
jgi:CrcB protein